MCGIFQQIQIVALILVKKKWWSCLRIWVFSSVPVWIFLHSLFFSKCNHVFYKKMENGEGKKEHFLVKENSLSTEKQSVKGGD